MTIPAIKQQHLATITAQERKQLGRIRPTGRAGPDAPDEAPSRNASGDDAPSSGRAPAATVLLALLMLVMMPLVSAQNSAGLEDFERCAIFDIPGSGDCTASQYTFGFSGTGSTNVVSTPAVGSRSLRLDSTSASSHIVVNFESVGDGFCDYPTLTNSGTRFKIQFPALPPAGENFAFGIAEGDFSTGTSNSYAYLVVSDSGAVSATTKKEGTATPVSGALPLTVATGQFYDFEIECVNANNFIFREYTSLESVQITNAVGTAFSDMDGIRFEVGHPSTGGIDGTYYVDDISFGQPPVPGSLFCSAPTEGNFGYDYIEQVVYDDSLDNGIGGLDDGFVFSGDSNDNHYMAKAFPDGTIALSTRAGIESQIADAGESSVFWIAYTTGTATLSQGATGDGGGDMTVAGDGDDSGNFADHIQARFVESGDDWIVSIQYNLAGAGRTQISSTVSHGNPDNPTLYIFEVNTGNTALDPHPMIGVASSYDGFPALPARTARVLLDDGSILMTRDLPAGLYDFVWKDQWFVSKGDSALSDSETFLDENEATANDNESTCIYDLTGTAVETGCYGSCGTAPSSTQPTESTTTTTTGGGTGFANAPAWLWPTVFTFLGAMVIAAILALLVGKAEGILFGLLGFTALIISIVAWGMPLYIPLLFLILPAIAITIWKGPWSN